MAAEMATAKVTVAVMVKAIAATMALTAHTTHQLKEAVE